MLAAHNGDPAVDVAHREAADLIVRWHRGDEDGVIRRLTSLGLDPQQLVQVSTGLLIAVLELLSIAPPGGRQIFMQELTARFGLNP